MNPLKSKDYWLTAAIETSGPWPLTDMPLAFRGRELLLMAETKELAQRVAIRCVNWDEGLEALRIVRQFLSVFAWVERRSVHEMFTGGQSRPANLGKGSEQSLRPWPAARQFSDMFYYEYLPEPADPRAWLALALFREALNVESVHYRFLSYYKIINILHKRGRPHPQKGGPSQVTWINQTLPKLDDWDGKKRLQELQSQFPDVGEYIYESGRCAIAHAFGNPVADPDEPKDTIRLSKDLRLVAALAEYAIEHEFGIKSASTVRKEHLYELAGFRALLGPDLSKKLKAKVTVELAAIPKLPRMILRARRGDELAELPVMASEVVAVDEGCIVLHAFSSDRLLRAQLYLHFAEESVGFAPEEDVVCFDDSSVTAVKYGLAEVNFFRTLFLNGRLEIWNADTGKCLGKTDVFLPQNVDMRRTLRNCAAIQDAYETMAWIRSSPFVDACDI